MHYNVTARLRRETAGELLRKLTDGTIEGQKPDGREIAASMERARVGEDGVARWSEQCFCETPLQHERETVYDHHFRDMNIEATDDTHDFEGEPFMEYLERAARETE